MSEYTRIGRELAYEGKIVKFYKDTIQFPNGNTAIWDFVEHPGAAAIVPVDSDGNIIMVRQYRNSPDRYTLEIPAGGLNGPNEDKKVAAMREMEEETGYRSEDAEHLLDLYTTFAYCNELIGIYYAENLIPSKQHLDPEEFLNVERHSIPELTEMILNGTIQDAKTIAAILAYKAKKGL